MADDVYRQVAWHSSTRCDFCGEQVHGCLHDAKTKHGCWATMCSQCAREHRESMVDGCGIGQTYTEDNDGCFIAYVNF